jgi:Flp pilus assembly protein TadB
VERGWVDTPQSGAEVMVKILAIGMLLIVGYLAVDELLFRLRPELRQRGIALLPEFERLDWRNYLPLLIAVILAWRFAVPLISGYLVILGVLITLHLARRARLGERTQMDRQVAQLTTAFRSIYQLRPTVFSALEQACKKVDQPLRGQVALAVEAFYISASPDKAFDELERRVDNVYLTQFVYILRRTEIASREVVVRALDSLEERLTAHKEMRSEAETNLASVTGQTRVIQMTSVIIVLLIAFSGLGEAYTSSWRGQLFFIIVVSVMVATSYLLERRAMSLKERIL